MLSAAAAANAFPEIDFQPQSRRFDAATDEFARTPGELKLVFGVCGLFIAAYVLIGGPIGDAAEAAARTFF